MFLISYIIYFLAYIMLIWFLCNFSQLLTLKVHELKIAVLNLKFSKENGFSQEYGGTEFLIEKESVYLQLNDFKGFNADDYFIVNNALITKVFSNFITHVIILMQFKFTEMSLK